MPHKTQEARNNYYFLRKAEAKAYVTKLRETTYCVICGSQPIDWHCEEGHKESARISHLMASGKSIARIEQEIAKCTPLCRKHHMKVDGRTLK
jgi:hypothetical protein